MKEQLRKKESNERLNEREREGKEEIEMRWRDTLQSKEEK